MIETIVQLEHKEDFGEQGFYSNSYLALDKRLNQLVAVKDVYPQNVSSESDYEKYFDEAKKLFFARHPRVLPVIFVGFCNNSGEEKKPRIVTKYFKKGSLNGLIKDRYSTGKSLSLQEILRYAFDIVQGMIHLHSLNILHLDLKASNVFVGDDDKLVLADFGQSQFILNGIVKVGRNIYPAILPPEGAVKKAVDKTADIYQFGLLLYSLMNYSYYRSSLENNYQLNTDVLVKLFRNDSTKEEKEAFGDNLNRYMDDIQNGMFPEKVKIPFNLHPKLIKIVERCITADIAKRFGSFHDVLNELSNVNVCKGVRNITYEFSTKKVFFEKKFSAGKYKLCEISIEKKDNKYSLSPVKNGTRSHANKITEVTEAKIHKTVFDIIDKL